MRSLLESHMLPLYVSALSISLLFIWRSLQLVISLLFCVKRRLAVRIRLQRISKAYTIIRRGDVPNVRHRRNTCGPALFPVNLSQQTSSIPAGGAPVRGDLSFPQRKNNP
jgi:hypothetical protein